MSGAAAHRTENADSCPGSRAATRRRRRTQELCRTQFQFHFSNREARNVFHDPARRSDLLHCWDLHAKPIRQNDRAIYKRGLAWQWEMQTPQVKLKRWEMAIPRARRL